MYVNINFVTKFFYSYFHYNFLFYSFKGWLVGCQASADVVQTKLHKLNFALGYATDDFVLNTNV